MKNIRHMGFDRGLCPPDMKYRPVTLANFRKLPQIQQLPEEELFNIEVVSQVFPFKANNYVVDELIDWDCVPNDPIYVLTFPQKGMLKSHHFREIAGLMREGVSREQIREAADRIRSRLNPNPAGQAEHNVPSLDGKRLNGMQHKYKQTVLFFPSQGQICHAFCTFCFRWPQFVGSEDQKFASREINPLIRYLKKHPEVSDVLITGGDPMVMSSRILSSYIEALLDANLPNLTSIRIGTKVLAYWPYRFLTDKDSDDLLALFERVVRSGRNLALMAHFNHPRELSTDAVRLAVKRVRSTGALIRTQSPLLKNINDKPEIWSSMWRKQVKMGCVPYYMFVVRNTGAQHYFGVPLAHGWKIFREAYMKVGGLARTVRGPSMSAHPGKIQVVGVSKVHGERVFTLQFLQGRNPDWVVRPFFAKYDEDATWLDDLVPAFGKSEFFFKQELNEMDEEEAASNTAS